MNTEQEVKLIETIKKSISDGYGVGFYMGDLKSAKGKDGVPHDIEEKSIYTNQIWLDVNLDGKTIVIFKCKKSEQEYEIPILECETRLIYQIENRVGDERQKAITTIEGILDISDRHDLGITVSGDVPVELAHRVANLEDD